MHLELVEGRLGDVFFVPARNLSQQAEGGGEQRCLPDTKQAGVLSLLPVAEAILREAVNVMGAGLKEEQADGFP